MPMAVGSGLAVAMALTVGASGLCAHADGNPGCLKIALVSMKCVYSDGADAAANAENIQQNLDRHMYFIDQATAQGAEFVGFPELSINGYRFSRHMTWLKLDGPEVQALARKAVVKAIYVSAGLAEQDAGGRKWNTQIVLGPDGKIVGRHHKIWLTKEQGFAEAGATVQVRDGGLRFRAGR